MAPENFKSLNLADRLPAILPLPLGEGRGEGNSIRNSLAAGLVPRPYPGRALRLDFAKTAVREL